MKKAIILSILSLTIVLFGVVIAFNINKNVPDSTSDVSASSKTQVTKVEPTKTLKQRYAECTTASEKEYRTYLTNHGTTGKNEYGQTIYGIGLTDEQWDTINKKRAQQYETCFLNGYDE